MVPFHDAVTMCSTNWPLFGSYEHRQTPHTSTLPNGVNPEPVTVTVTGPVWATRTLGLAGWKTGSGPGPGGRISAWAANGLAVMPAIPITVAAAAVPKTLRIMDLLIVLLPPL